MKAIVGVFKSRSDAERGAAELVPLEIPKDRINILTPEASDKEIAAVPTVTGEQPGMGKAMGAVVGGAMGVAGGAGLVPGIAMRYSKDSRKKNYSFMKMHCGRAVQSL
jgi:hypothetical protein